MTVAHPLWLLLNLTLLVGLALAWFRLFARPYSLRASLGLLVVTLAMCGSGDRSTPETAAPLIIPAVPLSIDQPCTYRNQLLDLPLVRLGQSIWLSPVHASAGQPASIAVNQSVTLSGLVVGLSWETMQQHLSPLPDRQFRYDVTGILHWRLLNLTVYRQLLHYTGTVTIARQPSPGSTATAAD